MEFYRGRADGSITHTADRNGMDTMKGGEENASCKAGLVMVLETTKGIIPCEGIRKDEMETNSNQVKEIPLTLTLNRFSRCLCIGSMNMIVKRASEELAWSGVTRHCHDGRISSPFHVIHHSLLCSATIPLPHFS